MNLTITGHHVAVTSALRAYVTSKLDRPLRHARATDVHRVDVTFTVEPYKQKDEQQTVKIRVCVTHDCIVATETNKDLYSAIDIAMNKLDRKLTARKAKLTPRHRKVAKRVRSVVTSGDRRIVSTVVDLDRRKSHVIPFVAHIAQPSQQPIARAA